MWINELNANENKIIEILIDNSKDNKWVSNKELAEILNTDERTVRRYIKRIRNCDSFEKIILTNYKDGYKLMNSDEEHTWLEKRKANILKSLKICWKDIKRYNLNNQEKIAISEEEEKIYKSLMKA